MARSRIASRNGRKPHGRVPDWDPIMVNRLRGAVERFRSIAENGNGRMAANAPYATRKEWIGGTDGLDPRRDISDECGYPKHVSPRQFYQLYNREAIPARVVECLAKESWRVLPWVYESDKNKVETPWERALAELGNRVTAGGRQTWLKNEKNNPVFAQLIRADILSGIGQFGAMLLGIDDGLDLSQPAASVAEEGSLQSDEVEYDKETLEPKGVKKGENGSPIVMNRRKPKSGWPAYNFQGQQLSAGEQKTKGFRLNQVHVFPEALALPVRFETNRRSPRHGWPTQYLLTFNDPTVNAQGLGYTMSSQYCHWSRVVHLADTYHTAGGSDVLAVQRMQPVLNHCLASMKVHHGSGEGYWKAVFAYLFFETHPQLGGDVDVDFDSIDDMMEFMTNGLQHWGILGGMGAKSVAPSLSDPTPHRDLQVKAICIKLDVPVPVFEGDESGEQASENNQANWDAKLRARQDNYTTPRVLAPFFDRTIDLGCLPVPQDGYKCEWPDVTKQSAEKQAQVATARAQAMSAALQGGVIGNLCDRLGYLVDELGMEPDKAKASLAAADGLQADAAGDDSQSQETDWDAEPPIEDESETVEPAKGEDVTEGQAAEAGRKG